MKFKFIISIMLISVMVLAGCSASETEVVESADITDEISVSEEIIDKKIVPERRAEVSGVVKEIIGNEVIIALLLKENSSASEGGEATELTDEEKAAKQAANKAAREAGKTGTGSTSTELSGETIELIIPVGTIIIESSGTGELIELNIADIYREMSVKIWLLEGAETDVNLAEFVQVLTR